MGSFPSKFMAFFLASSINSSFFVKSLNANAASSLAAWSLSGNGELLLRTSVGSKLKAFYQYSDNKNGTRIWIDFPGELIRPRRIKGNGPIQEIRLGKPKEGFTRFVIEFKPSISILPSNLELIGISPDLWKLKLVGLPAGNFKTIGEGYLDRKKSNLVRSKNPLPINTSNIPVLQRGLYKVVIDPGHGGPDPGAIGIGNLRETDIVLEVSLSVARILETKGVKVDLTRTSEIDLDLPPRVALANRSRATAFISIHANASRNVRKDVNGIETFYFSGKRGYRLAANIQKELLKVSPGSPDRGVRKGRFFVIRRTTMPAALVEIGFLTGRFDGPLLASTRHRRNVSLAIAKGIINYLKEEN